MVSHLRPKMLANWPKKGWTAALRGTRPCIRSGLARPLQRQMVTSGELENWGIGGLGSWVIGSPGQEKDIRDPDVILAQVQFFDDEGE